jgi:aquaporin TIP
MASYPAVPVMDDLRRAGAEFVGTFTVVFAVLGSLLSSSLVFANLFAQPGGNIFATGLSQVATAFAAGLAVAVMVSALGHISGGHFNPAVTLGFFVTQRITPLLAVLYWVAQFGAAALAALLLRWIIPGNIRDPVRLGAPALAAGVGQWQGLVLEAVLTAFLVWVYFATAADPRGAFRQVAGLAIGLTVTMVLLVGGPFTGAAVNPARAFGPELVQNVWGKAWIWYAAAFGGAAIAALLYDWLYLQPFARPASVGPPETGVAEPAVGAAASLYAPTPTAAVEYPSTPAAVPRDEPVEPPDQRVAPPDEPIVP